MLSRVAESLMWMARYLERANSLSGLVEAIEELSLDHSHQGLQNEKVFWSPVYDILSLEEEKKEYIKSGNREEILHHLLLDSKNSHSVASSISAARFNARGIRDQIITELWELINDLHLYCLDLEEKKEPINISEFNCRVFFSIHCFRGLLESVMMQTEAWSFLMLGSRLERADQMSRLLDLKTFMLPKEEEENTAVLEPYVWLIIKNVSGNKSNGFGNLTADWPKFVNLLIFDLVNPNSIRFSVSKVREVLHSLSGSRQGIFSNSAEEQCSRLLTDLDYASYDGIKGKDLHKYLDHIQLETAKIFQEILQKYTHSS